jgi:hypothetical protein
MTHLLIATYFIEAGLLLIVAPWTTWWRQNFFAAAFPWVQGLMAEPTVRVLVVVVGALTAVAGLVELRSLLARWWTRGSSGGRARRL